MGLRLSAITNGYDLDAYIGLLEEFEFDRLQITVDGVGRLNDRRRLHGSYFRESCGEAREIFAYVAPRAVGKVWKETGEDELSVSLAWPLSRFTEAEREKLMTTTSQQEMFSLIEKAGIFPGAVNMED